MAVTVPSTKVIKFESSVFAPGEAGAQIEHEEDIYHCIKDDGNWKIQTYDDPNSLNLFPSLETPGGPP